MVARLDGLNQEIVGLEAELERLRGACSNRARRTAWRWITKCASWARTWRAPIRGFRWRGWNWSGCGATRTNPPSSASATAPAVAEKERLRAAREEALEAERQELEKLEAQAAAIGEEHASHARATGGRGGAAARASARPWRGWNSSSARPARGATPSRRKSSGWASERARLLADNIELDRRSARAGRAKSPDWRRAVNEMRGAATRPCAKPCARAKRS